MPHPETSAGLVSESGSKNLQSTRRRQAASVRDALAVMLGPNPTRAATHQIVDLLVRGAEAHVRRRLGMLGKRSDRFGLTLGDLALDCVANLLERDEAGGFPQLDRYFPDGLVHLDEVDILHRLRRLTGRAVDDGLYRRYADEDPQLARLIRNLQRGCATRRDVSVDRRMGALHLTVRAPARPAGLPLSRDRLEAYMMAHIQATDNAADFLDHFVRLIRADEGFARSYPLVGVALAIRAALSGLQAPPAAPEDPARLADGEAIEWIRQSVADVARACRPKYVGKGKVDPPLFDAYCAAVEDALLAWYRHDCGTTTLSECLQEHLPEVSREEYRDEHRARCEYVLRLAKARLKIRLRNLRTFSADSPHGDD